MVLREGWLVSVAFASDAKGLAFGCEGLHSDRQKVGQSLCQVCSGELSMNYSTSCSEPKSELIPHEYRRGWTRKANNTLMTFWYQPTNKGRV